MNAALNKNGQLMVVIVGFFATVQLLAIQTGAQTAPLMREGVTLILASGCAVRYWWVILLLPWPIRWFRIALLLLAWCMLPAAAANVSDPVRWAFALAALSAIGCATEVYNAITRQWAVGAERMARSLKVDHLTGAASAGGAAICLLLVALLKPDWVDVLIPLMVFADWTRLILMIRRHERLIDGGLLN